jgi:hypothetical protein
LPYAAQAASSGAGPGLKHGPLRGAPSRALIDASDGTDGAVQRALLKRAIAIA